RKRWGLALAVVAVLSLAGGLLLWKGRQDVRDSFAWVTHTQEVLKRVESIAVDLEAAESAQRTYLLLGDRATLSELDAAVRALNKKTADLERLTIDNPVQQARMPTLRQHLGARIEMLRRGIHLK